MNDLEKKLKHYRIQHQEYEKIVELLGREPKNIEWALFSALWSEHCSYKSSRIHLKNFYNSNVRVLEAFGENAGVIDLGLGERVAFKMESHNHPSFIEPYQGAATGVGGILRDIFTMGARPVALANYLCFGEPQAARMSHLVEGVVSGISGYGNCVGVPMITGQTEFDRSYNNNILVNALAVGLFAKGDKIFTSRAQGPGNYVVYVGAKTGKDGVHGASMASESFEEDSESKKPNVQVGDPFYEKLLIESCLEVMAQDLVVAIQDMGAAGLTSSSFEMASKGGVGFKIHLDRVPVRDSSITPEEVLLSESQERMLLICEPANFKTLQGIFKKWNLDAEVIGEVVATKKIEIYWQGELLTDIDPDLLVENAPCYERPYTAWTKTHTDSSWVKKLSPVNSVTEKLMSLLRDVRATSRQWIYRQYDQRVGARTARDCSDSVGVIRLRDTGRALGLVLGHRPYLSQWDAGVGAGDAIFYPALELSAKGFQPLAVTDCLNFGNPEKKDIMSEFVVAVEKMSEACEVLDTPVISGNVSFYNETQGQNIISTPATGMVGLRDSLDFVPNSHFVKESSQIYLMRLPLIHLSGQANGLGASSLNGHGRLDAKAVASFCQLVFQLSQAKGVEATRVCGKMGLAYSLVRMCTSSLGFSVTPGTFLGESENDGESKAHWFTEHLYEVLFVVNKEASPAFAQGWSKLRSNEGIDQLWRLGEVIPGEVHFEGESHVTVGQFVEAYKEGWRQHFESLA